MDEAIAGTNLHLEWNGPSDGDAQRQIDLIGDAVQRHVYGIAINPPSLYAANGVIRDALANDIPVVILEHRLPLTPQAHLSFVLEDLRAGAMLVATRLRETLPEGSSVMLAGLDSLSAGGQDRFTAMEQAIHEVDPTVRIAARIVEPPSINAFQSAIADALSANPNIRAIIALDNHAGYAAASIVHRSEAQNGVHVLSFDQNTEVLASLRRGGVDAVVVQNMRAIGRLAIANILSDRKHQPVTNVTYVTPLLVTRDNIDTEAVQQILLMNWVQP
ncbi:MAG: substrate-binding domain-containing protein [Acidobacteriota bacterium]